MSQWTHVLGVIRYDSLTQNVWPEPMDKEETVRQEAKTIDRLFKTSPLPAGSEGPIEIKTILTNRGPTVVITGDLRDFGNEDVQEILTWITQVCNLVEITCETNKFLLFLRDGIIQCKVEGIEKPIVFVEAYIDDQHKWVNIEEISNQEELKNER